MSHFSVVVDEDIFDVADPEHTVIAHGVNRFGVMGGFAALIDKKFPKDSEFYRTACPFTREDLKDIKRWEAEAKEFGDKEIHGLNLGTSVFSRLSDGPTVAHICSQAFPGADARADALQWGLHELIREINVSPAEIRLPLIGGGIGGIEPWRAVDAIYHATSISPYDDVTVVLYLRSDDPSTAEVLSWVSLHTTIVVRMRIENEY